MFIPKKNVKDFYFGNGVTQYALYPLEYDYVESFNFASKSKQIIKKISSKYTKQKNYPKTKKTQPDDLDLAYGLYHKFNFIKKTCLSKFPRTYTFFNTETSTNNKAPYVLEVKKNGNIILYHKKTGNIFWQSNSDYKGTGPYNLRLTNERKLILEDSTGKITYQSKDYKETPTIWYSFGKTNYHVYNGLISNKFESKCVNYGRNVPHCSSANILHIYTDNDSKYTITYSGRIKGTNIWFRHNNKGSYSTPTEKNVSNMNAFKITLSGANGYDICYTAYTNEGKWTDVACNGDLVVANGDAYITNLIIYVKETSESIPQNVY